MESGIRAHLHSGLGWLDAKQMQGLVTSMKVSNLRTIQNAMTDLQRIPAAANRWGHAGPTVKFRTYIRL